MTGGMPLYRQVYLYFKEKIGSEWPVGMRLSPEPELARDLGVSRPTVRHALALAQREGLIVRKKAKGTFVEGSGAMTSQKVTGSFMHLLRFDKRITVEVLPDAGKGDPLPEMHARVRQLGILDAGRLRRKAYIAAEPLAYMENFLDAKVLRRLDRRKLRRTPVVAMVESILKTKIVRAHEEIEAAVATPYLGRILQVGPGTPLLRVQRIYENADGAVIDYGIVWYRADRYRFTVDLSRDSRDETRPAKRRTQRKK
jgi:GntR family transcriptional regulator